MTNVGAVVFWLIAEEFVTVITIFIAVTVLVVNKTCNIVNITVTASAGVGCVTF